MKGRHEEVLARQGERRLGASVLNTLGGLCEICSCLRTGFWKPFLGFHKHRGFLFIFPLLQILHAVTSAIKLQSP